MTSMGRFTLYKRVNERWKKASCTYIYNYIYVYIYTFAFCLVNTDVLLNAKCETVTVCFLIVTPDDWVCFAAVVCAVEILAESGVV